MAKKNKNTDKTVKRINDVSKPKRLIKQEWLVQEIYNNEYVFRLDPDQIKKFRKWMKNHKHESRRGHCAIAVGATFYFTQTSLGEIAKAKCGCGKTIDLTDYDKW